MHWASVTSDSFRDETLRVQVPFNHILTQNLYYGSYYPNPKYPIIRYMDPYGEALLSACDILLSHLL